MRRHHPTCVVQGNYIVVDEQGDKFEVPQDKARPVDPNCLKGVEDLLSLGDFNEGALLHNVRQRYFDDLIYTGIGSAALTAVNPFQNLPGLYSEAKQKFYRDRSAAAGASGDESELPPHLFSVAAAAYTTMLSDARNQSIIISGESGAGKTEATKRILTYFANLQRSSSGVHEKMSIEEQVLRSNPILEAFGNAKTIRNDNSSRFGKFIDIEFDSSGKLQSARISNYLLEKSRIVKQQPDERGYHAFYQLCAGAGSLPGIGPTLGLRSARAHAYTTVCTDIPGVDDTEQFQEAVECMDGLGFSTEEKNSVFQIVAAVLHLGDMQFEEGDDGSRICDAALMAKLCELLQVSKEDFTNTFQYRTMEDPFSKKIINMPQDPSSSSNTRHAMAKHLYSRLFDWLVWRINQSTAGKGGGPRKDATKKIGILDIYGFEVFEWNSFEQLCINFANEKLQQHFNSHMTLGFFMTSEDEREFGVAVTHSSASATAATASATEVQPSKIYNTFKNSKVVYKPSRFASTNFAVAHYAGEVVYDVLSFLEKNTDKLHADIITLLKSSSMAMCKTLFSDPRFTPDMQGQVARAAPSPPKRGPESNQRAKQNVTVSMMFRQQLDQLVEDLNRTNPRYIRCIKPNGNKQAHEMDSLDVQRQLRCAGMLESIRIRRAGYSVRRPFKEFFNRFRILCPHISTGRSLDPDYKELSRKILMDVEAKFEAQKQPLAPRKQSHGKWEEAKSSCPWKEELQGRLEKAIGEAVKVFVLRIQKRWRGFRAKRRFRQMKAATLQMQAMLRTLRLRSLFLAELQKSKASVTLQCCLRMLAQRSAFLRRRSHALRIQTIWRGWSCRRKIGKLKGKLAADRIQKMREDEEKKQAFDEAKKAAQEKAKALEDMQKQLAEERERAERDATQRLEEERQRIAQAQSNEQAKVRESESGQLEQLRKELFESRKENARLQGQLDTKSSETGLEVSSADYEALRAELQDVRREKVRLEVEMTTCKSAEEFTSIAEEVAQLREECSSMRRAKLSAETQLEQKKAQLATSEERVSKLEAQTVELQVLKSSNDDLQIQLQRLTAQNQALEQRAAAEASLRNELRDLKVEKIRLEGDLDTLKLREEAMSAKLKGSDKAGTELQQLRSRAMAAEAELEQSRHQLEALQQQLERSSRQAGNERASSLDQLRSELLARIESKPTQPADPGMRPSILPDEDGRKSMLNQREMMEKLKQQFNEATRAKDVEQELPLATGSADRELELEEQLRQVRKENVELSIKVSSLQEDLKDKQQESSHLLGSSSGLKAEVEDLKIQLEQELSAAKRHAAKSSELQDQLLAAEAELPNLRRRLTLAEEQALQAQEEVRVAQQRCSQMQDDSRLLQQQLKQFQATAAECALRERTVDDQLKEYKDQVEVLRQEMDMGRSQSESSQRRLHAECERLKVELTEANAERGKMRSIVDEVLKAQESQDLEKWKLKAAHFEKKYAEAKKLNEDMTQVMSHMTQAVSGRPDGSAEAMRQIKELQRQLEAKMQELRNAKQERDEAQHTLNELQSSGEFFKDKYRDSQNELRSLREEHAAAAKLNGMLKNRLEALQLGAAQDLEDGKSSKAALADGSQRSGAEVQELQSKLETQDVQLNRLKADVGKQHEINECLRMLTVLEAQHREICESWCERAGAVMDSNTIRKTDEIKAQVQTVMRKLDEIVRAQK
ncbi:XI-K [Symbiodinium pilosum]|uniref:XI-K protein n=1 Tax=Symbiodinium pilosum TaxID=2952 RepID=A0A812WCP8_SYMPI|nr:XI-K [Symbiodinium pilosum]